MKKYSIIITLTIIAIVNAAYLSYKSYVYHFVDSDKLSTVCDFSRWSSCTDVLRNPLSLTFGIPFPWIALLIYPVLLGLAWYGHKRDTLAPRESLLFCPDSGCVSTASLFIERFVLSTPTVSFVLFVPLLSFPSSYCHFSLYEKVKMKLKLGVSCKIAKVT